MALSLNWKRLSKLMATTTTGTSKVTKKTGSKSQKTASNSASKKSHKVTDEVISNALLRPVSPLEYALWTLENTINAEQMALLQNQPLVISARGSDARKKDIGKYVAIDCEFVGVGPEGADSALARVSVVNFYGHVLLDKFVRPREKVTDWRTWVSGVTPHHMTDAISFEQAQRETDQILQNRVLVGHAVHHDLDALFLLHPKTRIRDTSRFKPFRDISKGKTPSLKKLTSHFLKLEIQSASHSLVEDARATMLLFRMHRKQFERTQTRREA